MKLNNGVKSATVYYDDGNVEYLYFWYANNYGRSNDNCSIVRSTNPERAATTARQSEVITRTRTSSWSGNVNFSKRVQEELGINKPFEIYEDL